MTVSVASVHCSGCKRVLGESPALVLEHREPCSVCGSTVRTFNEDVKETAATAERLKRGLKRWLPGIKKPIYGEVRRYDLHRETGLWGMLLRVIDRRKNRYLEGTTNAETGETVRFVDEPLTDHTGRGSPKAARIEREAKPDLPVTRTR